MRRGDGCGGFVVGWLVGGRRRRTRHHQSSARQPGWLSLKASTALMGRFHKWSTKLVQGSTTFDLSILGIARGNSWGYPVGIQRDILGVFGGYTKAIPEVFCGSPGAILGVPRAVLPVTQKRLGFLCICYHRLIGWVRLLISSLYSEVFGTLRYPGCTIINTLERC
jgi:hypothetical protein